MHRILDAETDATVAFLDGWVQRQDGRRMMDTATSGQAAKTLGDATHLHAREGVRDGSLLALHVSPTTAATDRLVGILAGQRPGPIALEITEHTRVQDYESLTAALGPLRDADVLLAVDDAGAGFSSL